mgnify:FL=1|tara:strand:+ start:1351 stop:1653 length:303 start_codon:yes stop_codon:yes gene_type:complete
MKITQQGREIAQRTEGAYSFDRFRNWGAIAQCLLDLGLTERQAEAVLLSKWTRWACDMDESGAKYGYHTSTAMRRFMVSGNGINWEAVKDITIRTLGVEQ